MTMRKDSRGRVRFGHKGHRIDVTKNGVNVYNRYWCRDTEYATHLVPAHFLTDDNFLVKLAGARLLAAIGGRDTLSI